MRAIISNCWIHFDNITTHEEGILDREFSISQPNNFIHKRDSNTSWDGVYRRYNKKHKRIARPFLKMLCDVCAKHNLPLVVADSRESWNYSVVNQNDINADFLPGITLDDYQVEALRTAVAAECGIIDIPTGGGKGEQIAGLCKAVDCPTVILADQRVVIDQLKSRLEIRDVTDDVGLFYAGQRPSGQKIVVGSIQSLTPPKQPPEVPSNTGMNSDEYEKLVGKWNVKYSAYLTRRKNFKELIQYIKDAEMIIVDECDRAISEPWKNLFRHYFSGRRRYGFSGTPFDESKPVQGFIMQEHLGSVIYKASRKHLTDIGRTINIIYKMFVIDGVVSESSAYDIAYNQHITNSKLFHELIARLCKKCQVNYDRNGTLILVDREEVGYNLLSAIRNIGLSAEFIFGKTQKKIRDATVKLFEERKINVLIGGKIVNRGLDLKGGCENLILATSSKLSSDLIQKIGRAVRLNSVSKSTIYDFFFRCNRYLYAHSKKRLAVVNGLGYDTKVIFPGGVIDGRELVANKFRVSQTLRKSTTSGSAT